MTSLAFDTHKAVKTLTEAGAAEPLAEAMVATIGTATGEHLATKTDLDAHRKATKADLEDLRKATKTDLEGLRKDLNVRIDSLEQGMSARIDSLEQGMSARMDKSDQAMAHMQQHIVNRLGGLVATCAVIIVVLDKLL